MSKKTVLAAAAALSIITTGGTSADTLDTEDRILVTATRTPVAIEDVLAPVIVITAEDLRRFASTDITEVLRLQAGLEIGRNGGPGQSTSLFTRGTNSNHTQVLVDGVRINPGTLGGAALQNIRPQDIERIEVVKGPRSSLYGTEAIGGVVNIITRRGTQPLQLEAEVGGGSFGTLSGGLGARGHGGDWYGGLRLDWFETDGYPPQSASTVDRGYDNTTVRTHLGYAADGARYELRHWQARGNTEYLDFFLTPVDQDFTNSVTAVELTHPFGTRTSSTLLVSRASDDIRQSQSPDFAETRRTSFDWQLSHEFDGAHSMVVGALHASERTRAEVFGTVFDEDPATRAGFVQHQYRYGGWRSLLAVRHTDHDAFGGHTTWNAELGHQLNDDWRVIAAAGTAFRAPDSTERFGFGGDPNLRPERARNLEVGVRGNLGGERRLEFQVFENRIEDLIGFDPVTFSLANIERARIQGAELAYGFGGERWRWRQSVVLQKPQDLGSGEPLPRRARQSMQALVTWDATEAVELGAALLATGRRKDSGFSPDYIGGYAVVNLSAHWRVTREWSLAARLENALDKDYETALGYPMAGRSLFVTARWGN